jgi:hypothetical protein
MMVLSLTMGYAVHALGRVDARSGQPLLTHDIAPGVCRINDARLCGIGPWAAMVRGRVPFRAPELSCDHEILSEHTTGVLAHMVALWVEVGGDHGPAPARDTLLRPPVCCSSSSSQAPCSSTVSQKPHDRFHLYDDLFRLGFAEGQGKVGFWQWWGSI